MTIIKLHF